MGLSAYVSLLPKGSELTRAFSSHKGSKGKVTKNLIVNLHMGYRGVDFRQSVCLGFKSSIHLHT